MFTPLRSALAALAFAAAACAQQPLDQPARSLCGSQTAQADVLCVDFSPLVGIGGSVQLPSRQMQVFVKVHEGAAAFLLHYRICDERGATLRERKEAAPAQPAVGEYSSYFQVTPAANEFVCALELRPLFTER